MESVESHGTVWETLALRADPLGIKELSSATGLDAVSLRRALGDLVRVGLLKVIEASSPAPRFLAVTQLDAIRWARAVELGVPLPVIERLATLEKRGRAEALRAASDGTLDRMRTRERNTRRKKREDLIRGRAASKAASTDLALLSKDLEVALRQTPVQTGLDERAARFVLEQALGEARQALSELTNRLMKQ
jgi:hypothetical protein